MRLFAGVPLPEPVVERLMGLRLRLATPRDGLRWSAPEQWHITLRFFGDVSGAEAERIAIALRGVEAQAAELAVETLGLFETKGILFAAVERSERLLALQMAVQTATASLGGPPESRLFRPHITLARSKGRVGHATLRQLGKPALPSLGAPMRWTADEVWLFESVLQPTGAEYTVLERIRLDA